MTLPFNSNIDDTLPKCAILWLIWYFTKVCNPVVDTILYQSVQSCGWYYFTKVCNPVVDTYQSVQFCDWHDTLPKCAILWLTRYFTKECNPVVDTYQSVQFCDWHDTLPKCAILWLITHYWFRAIDFPFSTEAEFGIWSRIFSDNMTLKM